MKQISKVQESIFMGEAFRPQKAVYPERKTVFGVKKSADEVVCEAEELLNIYHDRSRAFRLLESYSAEFPEDYRIWLGMARATYPFDEALKQINIYYGAAEALAPDNKRHAIKAEFGRLLEDFDAGKKRRMHDLSVQIAFSENKARDCGGMLEKLKEQIAAAEYGLSESRKQSAIFLEKAEEYRLRAARFSIKPPNMFLVFAIPIIIAAVIFAAVIAFSREETFQTSVYIAAGAAFCAAGAVVAAGAVRTAISLKLLRREEKQLALSRQLNENTARLEALVSRLNKQYGYIADTRILCESDVKKMYSELSAIKTSREILNI